MIMKSLNKTNQETRYDVRISCKYHSDEIANTTLDNARRVAYNIARAHHAEVKLQIRPIGGGNYRIFETFKPDGYVENARTGERTKYIIKSRL